MKKWHKGVLVSIVFALTGTQAYGFTDIDETDWYYQSVDALEKKGVFDLGEEELFSPDSPITRGEFITLLMKTCYPDKAGTLQMSDSKAVPEEYLPYLGAAQELGVFSGIEEASGKIYANAMKNITRQDASVILAKLLALPERQTTNYVDGKTITPYAKGSVFALEANHIWENIVENVFQPEKELTKAEAVVLVERASESNMTSVVQENIIQYGTLTTYAGMGGIAYKDGAVKDALFAEANGIAGENGILYIMDTKNNLIRKIENGTVSTMAGTVMARDIYGAAVGTLQDGKAKEALFNRPLYGDTDSKGNLFISDSENNVIREVTKGGEVYTFCGNGAKGYQNGIARNSLFSCPGGIAIDKNDMIYVADTLNHCIRKIMPNGESSLVAGSPEKSGYLDGKASEALFLEPVGIAVDDNGVIYVSDTGNQRIRKIENGVVSTIAGSGMETYYDTEYKNIGNRDGAALEASLAFPMGLELMEGGSLLIADSGNHEIRLLTKDGILKTIVGNGEAGYMDGLSLEAMLNTPTDVYYSKGNLYIADSVNNVIRKIELNLAD